MESLDLLRAAMRIEHRGGPERTFELPPHWLHSLADCDRDLLFFTFSDQRQRDLRIFSGRADKGRQLARFDQLLIVEELQDVVLLESGVGCGAIW